MSIKKGLSAAFKKYAHSSLPLFMAGGACIVGAIAASGGLLVIPAAAVGGADIALGVVKAVNNHYDKKHPKP